MMAQTDDLLCLFSAEVSKQNGGSVIEIPTRELEVGEIREGETYRVGLYPASPSQSAESAQSEESKPAQPTHLSDRTREPDVNEPPVEEGEVIDVEIEDLGDQGDGIARIGPGFIVFVSDTEIGDRVSVEITSVKDTLAFGEVRERY
jgi:predicted RNA-binding protein with TRAM domain